MSNTHRRRRRDATDATVELRRIGVGGVYWALVCSGRAPLAMFCASDHRQWRTDKGVYALTVWMT